MNRRVHALTLPQRANGWVAAGGTWQHFLRCRVRGLVPMNPSHAPFMDGMGSHSLRRSWDPRMRVVGACEAGARTRDAHVLATQLHRPSEGCVNHLLRIRKAVKRRIAGAAQPWSGGEGGMGQSCYLRSRAGCPLRHWPRIIQELAVLAFLVCLARSPVTPCKKRNTVARQIGYPN
jgi:hypothetical protein